MTTARTKTAAKAKIQDPMAMSAEIPVAVREFTEKGLEQAKEGYAKFKAAAEETTDAVEDTLSTTTKGVTDWNMKAMDMAKDNMTASFDFAKSLFGVSTVSEAIELQTGYARKQYETAVSQSKELSELAGDFAKKSAQPMTDTFQKTAKDFGLNA